jgi:hypothetical protein
MKRLVPIASSLVLYTSAALAWVPADNATGALREYVNSLRSVDSALFVSSCQLGEHLKAVVVLPAGEIKGVFLIVVDRNDNGIAAARAMSIVALEKGQPKVTATTADEAAKADVDHLARYLMSSDFRLLPTQEANQIFQKPGLRACTG